MRDRRAGVDWVQQPYVPPVGGETGGGESGGGGDPGGTVTTPTYEQTVKLIEGQDVAYDRLACLSDCADVFAECGVEGADVLARTSYLAGADTEPCKTNSTWAAWTRQGSSTVYLCAPFATLSSSGAAMILIHEALHSAGMGESADMRGSEMTSAEINDYVGMHCNLQW